MSKFEIYKDKKGETRFRFRASNGEIMFSSEGYKQRASATKAIESLKKNVASASVEDLAAAKPAAKAKAQAKPAAKAKAAAKPAAKAKAVAKKAIAKPAAKAKAAVKSVVKKVTPKPKAKAPAKA